MDRKSAVRVNNTLAPLVTLFIRRVRHLSQLLLFVLCERLREKRYARVLALSVIRRHFSEKMLVLFTVFK